MKRHRNAGVVHSYDTERHEVRCGTSEQTNSTKYAAAVTCTPCREILGFAPVAPSLTMAPAAVHEE